MVQKAGIPRKRLPAVLYKHPAILSRRPDDVLSTCRYGILKEGALLGYPLCRQGTCHVTLACISAAGKAAEHVEQTVSNARCTFRMLCSVLEGILGSPEAAVRAVPRHPQLLAVDLAAQHAALLKTFGSYGLSENEASQVSQLPACSDMLEYLQFQPLTALSTFPCLCSSDRCRRSRAAGKRRTPVREGAVAAERTGR